MKRNYAKGIFLYSCLFVSALVFVSVLLPSEASAVTVGPVRLEYQADPGDVIRGELFLKNEESATRTFYPSFERFTEDESGQKNFLKEESDLATWFQVTSQVTLRSGEDRRIPFAINLPDDAPPGGHFAVIWWSTSPPGRGAGQVAIVTRAGILVYLTVSGELNEVGTVETFRAPRIVTSLPISFSILFKNDGNSYLKPFGTLRIANLFGGTAAERAVNEFGTNILPGTSKNLATTVDTSGFFFGPYRATLTLSFGDPAEEITRHRWLWVFPVVPTVAILALLALLFFGVPRGIKKYNAWVISKARS